VVRPLLCDDRGCPDTRWPSGHVPFPPCWNVWPTVSSRSSAKSPGSSAFFW